MQRKPRTPPPATLYTLIVDGAVVPYVEGDEIPENGTLLETEGFSVNGNTGSYRAELYVKDGVIADQSVTEALGEAEVSTTGVSGATVIAVDNDFNGVIVENGEYEITDSSFVMTGNTADDCIALGSGVYANGNAKVHLDNVYVDTKGVLHAAMVADYDAEIYAEHSEFHTADAAVVNVDDPTKCYVPWCLGVSGTSRGINLTRDAHITYFDSLMTSEKWGVLAFEYEATGSGNSVAVNSEVAITGGLQVDLEKGPTEEQVASFDFYTEGYKEDSTITSDDIPGGYGTLVYGDTLSAFAGSTIYTPSYGAIICSKGGTVLFTSSSKEALTSIGEVLTASNSAFAKNNPDYQVYAIDEILAKDYEARNTVLYSDRIGVMAYDNDLAYMDGGEGYDSCKTIVVNDGTQFITGGASMIVKGFPTNIFVDDASLVSGRNIILQVEDCDDPALTFDPRVNGLAFTADYTEPTANNADTRERTRSLEELNDTTMSNSIKNGDHLVTATYSNMETLNGDIYNSCGTSTTFNGGAPILNLYVVLDNIGAYNGTISASRGYHTTYTYVDEEGKEIGVISSPDWWNEYANEAWFAANGWTENDKSWHYLCSEYTDIPCASVDNGVIVEVKNGSVWNVAGTSYLTKLIVSEDATVNGTMTVNGTETAIVPGVYEGEIVIEAK